MTLQEALSKLERDRAVNREQVLGLGEQIAQPFREQKARRSNIFTKEGREAYAERMRGEGMAEEDIARDNAEFSVPTEYDPAKLARAQSKGFVPKEAADAYMTGVVYDRAKPRAPSTTDEYKTMYSQGLNDLTSVDKVIVILGNKDSGWSEESLSMINNDLSQRITSARGLARRMGNPTAYENDIDKMLETVLGKDRIIPMPGKKQLNIRELKDGLKR